LTPGFQSLENAQKFEALLEASYQVPQFVFKHSTRCSISTTALRRFDEWLEMTSMPRGWYLDLIRYRDLSNAIGEVSGVQHESPQVLLFRNGKCVYHASHLAIRPDDLAAAAKNH